MSSADLVGRLREPGLSAYHTLRNEAADEIERLEKQIETMARAHDGYYADLTAKLFDAVNAQTAAESRALEIEAETREACAAQPHPAEQILAEIEARFPNWRSYRDLVDCIDCTLHNLRKYPEAS